MIGRSILFALGLMSAVTALQAQDDHSAHTQPGSSVPDGENDYEADIAAFRENFLARDKSYRPEARAEADERLNALQERLPHLSALALELELARIAALADNGHSNAAAGPRSRRYNRVQLRLAPFGEGFYVLRAPADQADLLGAELVAIDDVPISRARAAARSLVGGTPSWRDRFANYLLESPEQMHALGLLRHPGSAEYEFRLSDGSSVRRVLVPEPANPQRARANADRWLYPDLLPEEGNGWRTILSPQTAPWSLREPSKAFRMRDAPELDAYVIEMRQMFSSEDMDLAQFAYDAEDAIEGSGRQNLVVDLRQNGGGDLNRARAFMRRLPRLVRGRIFVLTSPWTFSAAISSIGYLEQSAPERVTIVGEEVGDRLEFFAEGGHVMLPASGASFSLATERHDYRNGCRAFTDCHGSVVRNPIAVASLSPDISAPWTIDDYRSGRDPAIAAVARALGR